MHESSPRRPSHTLVTIAAVGLISTAPGARAEPLQFAIGAFAAVSQSPFDSDKTDAALVPDFMISGDRFSLGTNGLSYDLIQRDGYTLAARLAPRWITSDPSDVAGLGQLDRDIAAEIGVSATMQFGGVEAEVEALTDISGTHEGTSISAAVQTSLYQSGAFSLGGRIGVTWMDANLATYSYGIRTSEAGGSLAAYRVDAALIPSIGLQATYALSPSTMLVGRVSAEFLPDGVTDSPIVARDSVVSAMVGLRYAF